MWSFANISTLEVAVIDSSKFQLSQTRTMLSQIGVRRTRTYDNPIESLTELMAEPCGMFLIDADLPMNISSLELIYGLRDPAIVPLCFTPILVTVSEPTKSYVEDAIRHGANSVLAKPFSPLVLKQRIERTLEDRDKLVLKDGRYVVAEMLDTMEARALSSDPSMLAAIVHGGGDQRSPRAALWSMIETMLKPPSGRTDAQRARKPVDLEIRARIRAEAEAAAGTEVEAGI